MSNALYLPFDTETGGLTKDSCLLTAHFAACDKNMNMIDELDLFVKPNDDQYLVSAQALSVNKINLIEHDKTAITYSAAGNLLRNFLIKHSDNGKVKLVPVGKNIPFDVIKVTETLLNKNAWNMYVSYRLYDITTMVTFLKRKGNLPDHAPESLEGLAIYFGIPIKSHTARGDNLAGIEVVKRLESL